MLRPALGVLSALAALWAVWIWLSGGVSLVVAGLRVTSGDAIRPLIVAGVAGALYASLSGLRRLSSDASTLRRRLRPAVLAALLTTAVAIVGLANNSWSAGGSDSYSYVSQADLWLAGSLKVPVPIAATAPWPNAIGTFTPFGYRAVPGEDAITPVTGPGLPLLMAAFKRVAGHAAAFLVAPLSGALLIWATFLVGRRLGSDALGLGGAWLTATSPTFLMMFKSPMSDVPAAAFWTLATWATLGTSTASAGAAGLAATMAILIRPNLVPLAAVLGTWALFGGWTRGGPAAGAVRRTAAFAIAALPGCLGVAAINTWLYGSPLSSGYGDLGAIFSLGHIPRTLSSYGRWLFETQTPIVAVGVIVLAVAPSRIWPTAAGRAGARLLAAVMLVVWALYAIYPAFDAWWFLRFLLPSWPAIFIGTTAGMLWAFERRGRLGRCVAIAALVALGVYGLVTTARRHVFTTDEGERRYATIATLVEMRTEPSAMILASMHVGSLRYYAGRATMRFDLLDEAWLDRTVSWLQMQGRHPYLLVEDWEMPAFRRRFAGRSPLGDLRMAPDLAYRAYRIAGTVYLFDLLRPDGPTVEPPPIPNPRPRAPLPATPPSLTARP